MKQELQTWSEVVFSGEKKMAKELIFSLRTETNVYFPALHILFLTVKFSLADEFQNKQWNKQFKEGQN